MENLVWKAYYHSMSGHEIRPFNIFEHGRFREEVRKLLLKCTEKEAFAEELRRSLFVPFPVSWTVKMKKKQKETQDILSYHTQAAGCSDKARAKASGGRQPIEECGRTGL